MKLTQQEKIQKEADKIQEIASVDIPYWSRQDIGRYVIRRIAAAERRGYKKRQREDWKLFTTRPK